MDPNKRKAKPVGLGAKKAKTETDPTDPVLERTSSDHNNKG